MDYYDEQTSQSSEQTSTSEAAIPQKTTSTTPTTATKKTKSTAKHPKQTVEPIEPGTTEEPEDTRSGIVDGRPQKVYKNATSFLLSIIGAYAGTLLMLQALAIVMWQKLKRREDIFIVQQLAKRQKR
ncbi:hypothetical protein ANCCAN_00849 [Ancylostoma caninum]|uniref:Uncharacterized protein n=1 Tax=Ancylostoma caninum TaxID=29170 RepID=A0A368H8F4_ANCCA|nr:hypothetical protein ANCCAN_00849 [Ancylostoma caninum]